MPPFFVLFFFCSKEKPNLPVEFGNGQKSERGDGHVAKHRRAPVRGSLAKS